MEELLGAYPLLVPVLIAVFWLSLMWVVSRVSGWSALADRYLAFDGFAGPQRRFRTVSIERVKGAPTSYNGVVTIGADPRGLGLSTFALFRPHHPPLFIPWTDITAEPRKAIAFDGYELSFSQRPGVRMRMDRKIFEWALEQKGGSLSS